MEPFELTDGVIVLRTPTAADVDAVHAVCQDPAVQEWTTVPSPYLHEHAVGFVTEAVPAGWEKSTMLTWAVRGPVDDRLVGMAGLYLQEVRSGEIGYWLAPEVRGRGYATRATALVVSAAFDQLCLDRLEWHAYAGNEASRSVALRAGFRMEGEIRGGAVQRGARRDDWVGTLLRDDPLHAAPTVGAADRP